MWVSYFDKTLLNKGDNLMKFMNVGFNFIITRITAEQVSTLSTSKDIVSSVKEVSFLNVQVCKLLCVYYYVFYAAICILCWLRSLEDLWLKYTRDSLLMYS